MTPLSALTLSLAWLAIMGICWFGWQLLRQNGRLLLRLEDLESRLDALEFDDEPESGGLAPDSVEPGNQGEAARADRFKQRSLTGSKIKRDGLKCGAVAPDFRLPRLDGKGDLALSELRGRRVLLVFSSPSCGPCVSLAPQLQAFHRDYPELEVVMISKGEPKENRAKVREHGLTFPIVLQQQWEMSRRYAIFATPVAYLIDEQGVIARDVAVGTDAILGLFTRCGGKQETRLVNAPLAA